MAGEASREISISDEYSRVMGSGGRLFAEPLVKRWLRQRGISVPRGGVVASVEDATGLAGEIGYPVVLKIWSDRLLHKTEIDGVRTRIDSAGELRQAMREMEEAARSRDDLGDFGFLLEEQVPEGVEVIVGAQRDAQFGPVLMVGGGGVLTDLVSDVSFRVLPVGPGDAVEMLKELKVGTLLKGFRGQKPADEGALINTIMGIASFAEEVSYFMESADFNPVIALPEGARVVDAKVVLSNERIDEPLGFEAPRTGHLGAFFDPRSVAVVGASASPGKIGNVIVDSLVNYEFEGRTYPVNPNRDEIMGVRCYPSLEELPETPELVIMVVDLEGGPSLMRRMHGMGSHNLLIVSGGGKELGGNREELEREIAGLARDLDIRVIGPNCIGAFDGNTRFDSFFHSHERLLRPPAGPLSFITQSGTWGCGFLEDAQDVGVAKMVSYGNRVDVDEGDLISYLSRDRGTAVIGSYVEGLSGGRKYLEAAGQAVRECGKPVVVFKAGRTGRSADAAVSHTGAHGGSYAVYRGAFGQYGVITTDSFEELFSSCKALAMQPPAGGPRAAMVSNGAGPMVNAIDLFGEKGLELVRLERRSVEEMRENFSFFYIVENPVDVTGSASAADYEFVIRTLMSDENVDLIMPYFVFQDTPLDESIAERMQGLNSEFDKPIVACAIGGPYTAEMSGRLERAGVPVLSEVSNWVGAASALVRWGSIQKESERLKWTS